VPSSHSFGCLHYPKIFVPLRQTLFLETARRHSERNQRNWMGFLGWTLLGFFNTRERSNNCRRACSEVIHRRVYPNVSGLAAWSATRCCYIAILWIIVVSFAAIILCIASRQVFVIVSVFRYRLSPETFGYTPVHFPNVFFAIFKPHWPLCSFVIRIILQSCRSIILASLNNLHVE
jgi:hypothetical protein